MMRKQLAQSFDGEVLLPGDPGYDAARAVWNAMVDRRPRLIARCRNVRDVQAAVRAARDLNLEIGVRCGGHSVVGLAVPNDGLMIDLTPMGAVRVDPVQKRARVQGGALLGALDRATGTLRVTSGEQAASLYFVFGQLFHAQKDDLEGEDVLREVLTWRPVISTLDRRSALPARETIKKTA